MDEDSHRRRAEQADAEPDADAGESACHQGDENEEPAQPLQESQAVGVPRLSRGALIHNQKQPAADREVRDEHMNDRNTC